MLESRRSKYPYRRSRAIRKWLAPCLLLLLLTQGCASLRVTDPPQTADEQFLMTEAATKAVSQLSLDPLRGRRVWVVSEYAFSTTQPYDQSFLTNEVRSPQFQDVFLIAELRARLLQAGARLAETRDQADVILEVRSGALAINRMDFLLGIPAVYLPSSVTTALGSSITSAIVSTPDAVLYRSIQQQGFGAVAVVAYWRTTGDLLAISGPFVGHTFRNDYFIFGYALQPVGNIPPTQVGTKK